VEGLEVISIEGLTYWYPDSHEPSLKDINLKINEGELILVVGPSGCGKSTLVRLINRIIPEFYGGKIKGKVLYKGKDIREYTKKEIAKNIGMIFQHPEKQIVLQDVEREIAFGLENINMKVSDMKRNVSEVMSFLNLSGLRDKSTNEISGGQKQRVAIASVVAMDPEVLIFDEPTSQLDPIAAEEVLEGIRKLNRDMGKTIILVEHRLDRCFDMADRIIFMEDGVIKDEGKWDNIPHNIDKKYFLPSITYIFRGAGFKDLPVNVKQAKKIINGLAFKQPERVNPRFGETILNVRDLSFEYTKGVKALNGVNFSINKGEVTAVMGENGAGKSTLFKIVAGLLEGYKGTVEIYGKNIESLEFKDRIKYIGYLSQNPNDYFGRETVFDEVAYSLRNIGEYSQEKVINILEEMDLLGAKDKNPRDLSGGEKQRVAIACTIALNPEVLILDEPTRGMDSLSKDKIGQIIQKLSNKGKAIIIITHDSDFAADYSHSVSLMFNGEIVASGMTEDVLYDSIYYSPQVARMFKNKCKIVKTQDAVELLGRM
jgi:energy-coupling factor transporter ATP-binding protein EcfA2